MSNDPSLSKNLAGEQFGGEGTDLRSVSTGEENTQHGGETQGQRIVSGGPQHDSYDGTEEKGFSLSGAGYAGPQNFKPKDEGECNPDKMWNDSREVPNGDGK